jgi:methylmalonyl-CoA/ethylmalonyl-CoA epimerase
MLPTVLNLMMQILLHHSKSGKRIILKADYYHGLILVGERILLFHVPAYHSLKITMNISHIEHLGIAVKNLDESIEYYEKVLGLQCYSIEEVKDQKVKTAFFKVGQTKIELLESTAPDGPIGKFIEKKGEGIHHLAFAVAHIEDALAEVKSKGVQLIDEQPRKGAEGLDIAFLHPRSTHGVLTELCTDNKKQ